MPTAEPLTSADTRFVARPLLAHRRRDDAPVDRPERRQRCLPGELRARAARPDTRVFFQTEERLTAADTDSVARRLHARRAAPRRSSRPAPGAARTAPRTRICRGGVDGRHARLLHHARRRWSAPTPTLARHLRALGRQRRRSSRPAPAGGNGTPGAELMGIIDDGTKVFFETTESLVASDTDTVQDVYQRSGGTTTLVSERARPAATAPARRPSTAPPQDGSKVFFRTDESLVSRGHRRRAGRVRALRRRPRRSTRSGPAEETAARAQASWGPPRRARSVFIETTERLNASPVDRDRRIDVYESTGGTVTLVTPGRRTTSVATNAYFVGASADGTRVLHPHPRRRWQPATPTSTRTSTSAAAGALTPAVHRAGGRQRGPCTPTSPAPRRTARTSSSRPSRRWSRPTPTPSTDVYERYGGATSLHEQPERPAGTGAYDATFRGVSPDGKRVFFRTAEALAVGRHRPGRRTSTRPTCPARSRCSSTRCPNHAQDFSLHRDRTRAGSFNFGPLGFGPTTFSLDDDPDPTLANRRCSGRSRRASATRCRRPCRRAGT